MIEASQSMDLEQGKTWAEGHIEKAVREFIRRGTSDSPMLEAKPVWALPFSVVIGRIREQGNEKGAFWTICGEVPCDFIAASLAPTPRDAARHFALKWQLDAARKRDSNGGEDANSLERAAESLYELAEDEGLWTTTTSNRSEGNRA